MKMIRISYTGPGCTMIGKLVLSEKAGPVEVTADEFKEIQSYQAMTSPSISIESFETESPVKPEPEKAKDEKAKAEQKKNEKPEAK